MKEAPFEIGQKIVALSSVYGYLEKGNKYWVYSLHQSPCCKNWYVDFGHQGSFGVFFCEVCNKKSPPFPTKNAVGNAVLFAPIEENTYENISKSLAVLPQDEVPDVKIKQLV